MLADGFTFFERLNRVQFDGDFLPQLVKLLARLREPLLECIERMDSLWGQYRWLDALESSGEVLQLKLFSVVLYVWRGSARC